MLVSIVRLLSFFGRVHFLGGLELFTAEFHLYSQLVHNLSLSLGFLIHEVLSLVLQEGGAFIPALRNQKVAVFKFFADLESDTLPYDQVKNLIFGLFRNVIGVR